MTTPNSQDAFTPEEREKEATLTTKWHAVFKAMREALRDEDIAVIWEHGFIITLGGFDDESDAIRISSGDVRTLAAKVPPFPNGSRHSTDPNDINYFYPGLYDRGE